MKCPLCGSLAFYVCDPDDPYETYEFEVRGEQAVFRCEKEGIPAPPLGDAAECHCTRCSWHGSLEVLRREC